MYAAVHPSLLDASCAGAKKIILKKEEKKNKREMLEENKRN